MAVALRGHQQLAWGTAALSWPSGTAAGDVAVVWCDWPDDGPSNSGWQLVKWATWWKVLTAADITNGPGTWAGRLRGLVVASGCRGLGSVSAQRGVTLSEAGAALLTEGWTDYYTDASTLTPATNRLGTAVKAYRDQYCAWWFVAGLAVGYQQVARDSNALGYRSFELLPTKGPNPPTLGGPSGQVDASQSISLSWTHNSSAGLPQEGFRVRVKPSSSGTWQYLKADGTLSPTEVSVSSGVSMLTIPTGVLSSVAWDWAVATSDSGLWSSYSSAMQITPTSPPTVAATLSTTAGDLSPDVLWTPTTPGGSQTAWQAAVAASGMGVGQAVWMSPVTAGTAVRTVCPAQEWTNGAAYQAYVRVQQTGGLWSAWTASTAQTVSWTPPSTPASITVTDGTPLTVTLTGIPTADVLQVQSSTNGTDWTALASIALPNATEAVKNPLAGFGVATFYRARIGVTTEGVTLYSAWITSGAVASTDKGTYLVAADNVAQFLPVKVGPRPARGLAQGVAVMYPLAAPGVPAKPRTDRTPTAGWVGRLTVTALRRADWQALVTWLTTRGSWRVRWAPEIDPDGVWQDAGWTAMALADRLAVADFVSRAHTGRDITFDWVEA